MKTTITEKDGKVIVAVKGELDTNTSPQFAKDIAPVEEMKKATVELDLSELEYMSSKALRIIVSLQQAVLKNGGTLSISKVTETVREVFDMTGLTPSFFFD